MKVLQKGNRGELIKSWQTFLLNQGFDLGTADGIFGNKTLNATKEFQEKYGLSLDGTVNEETTNKSIELGFEVPEDNSTTDGVTAEQLDRIIPHASQANKEKYLEPINKVMGKYEINTSLRQAHFLAQIAHESGSLKYSEEIASGKAYEGRKDLGNTSSGDGNKFKGRGLIQLTGRANYISYGNDIGIDLTENPSQVATDPELCVDVAGWYWMKRNLNKWADEDNVREVTRKINGGYNGLDDRIAFLQKAKRALDIS